MKKNKKFYVIACLFIISIFLLSSCNSNNESTPINQQLLDEMKETNMDVEEIIHLEVVKDGILVFYTKDNNLYDGFIKLKGAKWEWYFGGGALPLQSDEALSWAGTNFDEFFVYYGVISDNKIKQVKDEDSDKLAKIVQSEDGLRIYLFIDETKIKNGVHVSKKMVPVYEN